MKAVLESLRQQFPDAKLERVEVGGDASVKKLCPHCISMKAFDKGANRHRKRGTLTYGAQHVGYSASFMSGAGEAFTKMMLECEKGAALDMDGKLEIIVEVMQAFLHGLSVAVDRNGDDWDQVSAVMMKRLGISMTEKGEALAAQVEARAATKN